MTSKTPRIFYAFALAAVIGLTGCVWFRLLETKNQLADFDDNFRAQVAEGHFVLNFLRPVLLSEDFLYLTNLNPSRSESLGRGYRWYLEFRSEQPPSRRRQPRSIVFSMTFNEDRKLVAWTFSPLFLEIAPPEFLEASLRSLGRGYVDEGKRQLRADAENLPRVAAELPTRERILDVLGTPQDRFIKDGMPVYKYRFLAQTRAVDPKYDEQRRAEAKLYFDPVTNRLARMSGRFAGLKLAIDYRKLSPAVKPDGKHAALLD